MSLISTTTPLGANGTFSTGPIHIARAESITGTVFADVNGTCSVQQGGDGVDWDTSTTIAVTGGTGAAINVPVVAQYFQINYFNGTSAQTVFRLYADPRDPYGAFLATNLPPSPGGQYAVWLYNSASNSYQWIGRFDGSDAWGAITNAVAFTGSQGKYAAIDAGLMVVSEEVRIVQTEHYPASF